IFPDAPVKLFVTASAEARAGRRWRELHERGIDVGFESVLADVKARDAMDLARAAAPLRPAPDAVVLDTTELDIDAAYAAALATVQERIKRIGKTPSLP